MYCTKCGQPNPEGQSACNRCGEQLQTFQQGSEVNAGVMLDPAPARLAQSILVTLFCCWPFGIPAIVFAAQTMANNSSGQFARAHETSKKSTMWAWISFGIGIASICVYVAMIFVGVLATP